MTTKPIVLYLSIPDMETLSSSSLLKPLSSATLLKVLVEEAVSVKMLTLTSTTSLVLKDRLSSVVLGPHLLIRKDFVGFSNVLEFLFGFFLVVRVLIRMPLSSRTKRDVSSMDGSVRTK